MFKSLIMHISKCGIAAFAAFDTCCICILSTYLQLVKKQLHKLFFVQQQYSAHNGMRSISLKTISVILSSVTLSLSGGWFVQSGITAHLLNACDAGWNTNAVHGRS